MKPFSELTGPEMAVELWRWVCVPLAAGAGVLLLQFIAGIAMPMPMAQPAGSPPAPVSDFQRFALSGLFRILAGAAFVAAGAKTAPRWRPATALGLAALWVLYSLLIHVLVHLGRGIPNYMDFVIAAGGAACGAAYVVYSERPKGQAE